MADNLNTQNNILTEDVASLGPSTEENQIATPTPVKAAAKSGDATKKRISSIQSERYGDAAAEQIALEKHKKDTALSEKDAIDEQVANDDAADKLQIEIDKLQANVDYANENGLSATAIESKIQELQVEKESLSGKPAFDPDAPVQQFPVDQLGLEDSAPAAESAAKSDASDISKQVQIVKQIRDKRNIDAAQKLSLQEEINEQRIIAEKAMQNMRDEDLKLNAIDTNRFWNSKNTWQKIGITLGMMFGGKNTVNVVQNMVNQDIEAQKLDNKSKLAKREEAFRRITVELNRLEGMTSDQAKIEKIKLAKQSIAAEQIKAHEERKAANQSLIMKDAILKKGIKLDNIPPSVLSKIFSPEDFKLAKGIRQEYSANPVTKDTAKIMSSYGRIEQSAIDPTAAGDMAMIFNFMKMLDPGSVVRESEFKNAGNAGSLPNRAVQKAFDGLITGRLLHPNQRRDFLNRAKMLLKGQLKTQQRINNKFKSLASKHGLPSSLIVEDFSLKGFSPREALFEKQRAVNKKLNRKDFDNATDRLIESGKLSDKFRN